MNHEIISQLKSQNTWRLFGLTIITWFVYPAHYLRRQTKIINQHCHGEDKISDAFVMTILVISYVSFALFVGSFFVDKSHPLAKASFYNISLVDILFLVWGFKARNRMNKILAAGKSSTEWFHGFWTFILTPIYFNFKVNQLNLKANQTVEPIKIQFIIELGVAFVGVMLYRRFLGDGWFSKFVVDLWHGWFT